jgi:hypothetical protein
VPPEVTFACVAENTPRWFHQVQNLAISIRRFGGGLAEMPIRALFVDEVDPAFVAGLDRFGVETVVVARHPLFGVSRASNKFRALEIDIDPSRVLIYLDCDVVVMGDLSDAVRPDVFRAAPDTVQHYSRQDWETVSAGLGIPLPDRQLVSASSGEVGVAYYNSGVMFIPAPFVRPLADRWVDALDRIQAVAERHGTPKPWRDQPPLTFALEAAAIPVEPLPPTLNWSCFRPTLAEPYRSLPRPPTILHYHRRIDEDGFVTYTHDASQSRLLYAFNRTRSESLDVPYAVRRYVGGRARLWAVRSAPYRWVKARVRRRRTNAAATRPAA